MSTGFLVTVIIWALVVAAVLWPPRRPILLARAAFIVSIAVGELPLLFLLAFAITAVQTYRSADGVVGPVDWTIYAFAVLVIAGMAVLYLRTLRARPAIADAVGLPPHGATAWWSGIFCLPVKPLRVQRISNVQYAGGGREHRLDVYRLRHAPGGAPVLIFFHGGGFSGGDKYWEGRHLWYRMAAQGWVVISANYALRPHAGYPEHLTDAKRVIAFARENADEYGIDPATVVVSGSSAGGHLAAMCALTPNLPEFQPGFESVDTQVSAAVCLYGYFGRYYGEPRGHQPSSLPADYQATAAPPVFVVHGTHDSFISVNSARRFVRYLREHSPSTVAFAELPGANHGFDVFAGPRPRAVVDGISHFLGREVLRTGHPRGR